MREPNLTILVAFLLPAPHSLLPDLGETRDARRETQSK
jgi:hypothetical protein